MDKYTLLCHHAFSGWWPVPGVTSEEIGTVDTLTSLQHLPFSRPPIVATAPVSVPPLSRWYCLKQRGLETARVRTYKLQASFSGRDSGWLPTGAVVYRAFT